MPEKTTATNDAAGNVSFGEITYTMENVFGAQAMTADVQDVVSSDATGEGEDTAVGTADDRTAAASAPRTKEFVYTVTESGSVAGVANDASSKTITVTVADNGDGSLSASKSTAGDPTDFTFVNTYKVTPQESSLTGDGNFSVTKTLDGRPMNEGEFEFALASQAEGMPEVLTATNDADGNVAFPAIAFSQPGIYKFTLAEVDGDLGGVTYDTTVYDVTATAADDGDGTMTVTWAVSEDGEPIEGTDVSFVNEYEAAGTSIAFNAAKVLSGRELKEGEFTFELRDGEGNVLQTVKNGALDGGYAPIKFDAIEFDEPGEFDYQIAEVKGNVEGVTYDETVFTYHVAVTDDGKGGLEVTWSEGETGAPVFRNTYEKPAVPGEPEIEDSKPNTGLSHTGDDAALAIAVTAGLGVLAVAVGIAVSRRKKKRD